ncbi:MAG: TIGR03663 family protein [Anaerolineae bacterium]|nr:TIGR03663 family protein [Anaerolineae bacterium]
MTVQEAENTGPFSAPFSKLEQTLNQTLILNGETAAYIAIFVIAVLTRFIDLGVRTMSHDESLHTQFSWYLYNGTGFTHTPLMHGPLLFHAVALSYLLFGVSDFSARIYPAVMGVIVVMLPIFMRKWLGKTGAIVTSIFLLISPMILYYSRYIRHDIPAILAALVMAIMIWRYIEERKFGYLVGLSLAQVVLFASKEVSFIYIAIFGCFITLFFITRLLEVNWEKPAWRWVFITGLSVVLIALAAFGALLIVEGGQITGDELSEGTAGTVTPLDPDAAAEMEIVAPGQPLELARIIVLGIGGAGLLATILATIIGQWRNLRRFPELDVAITMGTLILPALTPFLIHFAGFNPMDSDPAAIQRGITFTAPIFLISVIVGLAQFMKPPEPKRVRVISPLTEDELEYYGDSYDPATNTVEYKPDFYDWVMAFFSSRWWAIGAAYWLIFIFLFTTMFTSGKGIGTGVIGSLGYWLEQQGVKRGGQPWYYYLVVLLPMYEFMPVILALIAGVVRVIQKIGEGFRKNVDEEPDSTDGRAKSLDLDAPITFPVLLFVGFWAVINLIAYSLAGEKMPWLTTHLTIPLILLSGWVVGQLLDKIDWKKLWQSQRWLLLILIPVIVITTLRVIGPSCGIWAANPVCNTIIPIQYQSPIFAGRELESLSTTGAWIAALLVLIGAVFATTTVIEKTKVAAGQMFGLVGVFIVGWLSFLTARSAWLAAYINYDYPTEFLVYAHSSGSVKDVMEQIEELSYKTTDGLGLQVAYDNRVSWPMSWYLRDYYNAVFFGEQPSRGTIGDAPVILAGSSNWSKVEALIGDRYYQFEYIRMWWPMQDYFDLDWEDFYNVMRDPELQRGLWNIFYNRDYDQYAQAVAKYRDGVVPSFELSEWPVPDRMKVYIRKDVFAQVWDYGVAASEIAEAIDPYAENVYTLPTLMTFGQGELNNPHDIDIGPDGKVYVADTNNHRVAIFDADGSLIGSLGRQGYAPTEDVLNEPWGVAVDNEGNVFVADTWNHRVVVYNAAGEYVTTWGVEGPNELENVYAFWGPRGIEVDDQGLVYVSDTGNKRVLVFTSEGDYVRTLGSGGTFEGQLDEPVGIVQGNDGLIYIADTWNQRISVFSTNGLFVRQWPVEAWYAQSMERPYLDMDGDGNLFVTDPEASRVIVFDNLGNYRYSFGDFSIVEVAGAAAADSEGNIYLVDTESGVILKLAAP